MLTRNETEAFCDVCCGPIGRGGYWSVEWKVEEDSEDCGQRFLCERCVNQEPDDAEFWAGYLLKEHEDDNAELIDNL
jgi:hypothetical protein